MPTQVGDHIRGKYRLTRPIGDGGMGSVFEAVHEALGTRVALKFLHADLARRPGLSERFAREARVSASIQSPHVARVTDVDATEEGTPFLVMELLEGESLAVLLHQALSEGRPLSRHAAIDFALQILSGLEAAHALRVVHRDLKPENVIVTPSPGGPVVKIIDFGIAKLRETGEFQQGLTHAGTLMGTPEYMSPEQLFSAANVDHRADLYSLGVMLFEMLSGQRPAQGDSAPAIVAQVQNGDITRLDTLLPDLPAELVEAVHRALAPRAEDRFESAFAMRKALSPFAGRLSQAGQVAAAGAPQAMPSRASEGVPDTIPPARQTSAGRTSTGTIPPGAPGPAAASTGTGTVLTAAHPAMPPGPPAATGDRITPPRRKRGGGVLLALGGGALILAAAIGVLAYHQYVGGDVASSAPPLPPLEAPQSAAVVSAEVPSESPTSAPPQSGETAEPAQPVSHNTPSTSPTSTPKPATPTPAPSGSAPSGFPGFQIPSSLPPLPEGIPTSLPSSLPPLPEGLPTALPSNFPPIPGLTPPAEKPSDSSEKTP